MNRKERKLFSEELKQLQWSITSLYDKIKELERVKTLQTDRSRKVVKSIMQEAQGYMSDSLTRIEAMEKTVRR